MSLKSIRSQLITLLDGIKVSAGFNDVYYDVPTSIEITPAVALILNNFNEELSDSQGNDLIGKFVIRVMVEKKQNDVNDTAQTNKLLETTDYILDELRKKANTTLNGETFFLLTTGGSGMLVGEIEQMKVFYVNIDVEVKSYNSIC